MPTQRVHQCEFCTANFFPRPQVKNPRACERSDCQKKRQRSNELAWRARNHALSDPKYHRLRKLARLKLLKQACETLLRYLNTGATIFGQAVMLEEVRLFFFQFLVSLGVRRVNKFWPQVFVQASPEVSP